MMLDASTDTFTCRARHSPGRTASKRDTAILYQALRREEEAVSRDTLHKALISIAILYDSVMRGSSAWVTDSLHAERRSILLTVNRVLDEWDALALRGGWRNEIAVRKVWLNSFGYGRARL